MPPQVQIVDSAATSAAAVLRQLTPRETRAPRRAGRRITWLATDGAERFVRVDSTFFNEALQADAVELVDL